MTKLTKEIFEDLYIRQLKTCEEIGRMFNLTKSGVRHHKRKWKVPEIKGSRFYLKLRSIPLSSQVKMVLLGSLLGDGSVVHHMNGYHFCIAHSIKQQEYALWKYNMLKDIMTAKPIIYTDSATNSKCIRVQSIKHPEVVNLRSQWYSSKNIKFLDPNIVKDLDPLGLAIWYMDDGFIERRQAYFSTCGFTHKENQYLVNLLKVNFDIDSKITTRFSSKQGKHYEMLKLDASNAQKLFDLILIYMLQVPCMLYKAGRYYRSSTT